MMVIHVINGSQPLVLKIDHVTSTCALGCSVLDDVLALGFHTLPTRP